MKYVKHNVNNQKYLILDLDETLIYSSKHKMLENSEKLGGSFNGYINLRPYVGKFLEEASKIFNLILFTASEAPYAE